MQKKANGKVREIRDGNVLLELPLSAAMNAECEMLAGYKNSKNLLRAANWRGSNLGPVYYDKQKVLIDRPRLRSKDNKEIPLATYHAFGDPRGMRSSVMKNMILGISSRNYAESVEGFLKGYGIKKSSVSRHFVKATAEQMREFMERDLAGLDLVAIFIDGIEFKGHLIVVALGLDKFGKKHILGLWQGATENAIVCTSLLEDISSRGLNSKQDYLFVLDGSKALRSAVAKIFGTNVTVQRCQQHKRRNVLAHRPKEHQHSIDARISAAYKMADYDAAEKSLELTVRYLEKLNPSAAGSLREGLEETLTVHKLGVTGLLRKTLQTTNPIESCFSVSRTITGRVKRWRSDDMVQRWAVASLLRAEKKFRCVKGYREIPKLIAALQQRSIDRKEAAA
jgi:transposase-like protein